MSKIFFCYRQDVLPELAERIYDRLCEDFGGARIVKDVPPGTNFLDYCDENIAKGDIILMVAGGEWASRLNNIYDFTRLQIETALQRKSLLVPVLLEDTSMPEATALPESVRPLLFRQAVQVRGADFESGITSLTRCIRGQLPHASSRRIKKKKSEKQKGRSIKDNWLSTPAEFRLSLYALLAVILVTLAYVANWVGGRIIQVTIFIVLAFYIARFSMVRKALLEYVFSLMLALGGVAANSGAINSIIGWLSNNIHSSVPSVEQNDISKIVIMLGISIFLIISALLWRRS